MCGGVDAADWFFLLGFPKPGSNRGYTPSEVVCLWMLVLHEGARSLEDVRYIREDKAFTPVVQRTRKGGRQCLDPGEDGAEDETAMTDGRYIYRALATHRDALTDSEIIHWYNRRGEDSENRIKELQSDFAGDRLPCGQFEANARYFHLCVTAYNLFVPLRHSLPPEWHTRRAITVRWRLRRVKTRW